MQEESVPSVPTPAEMIRKANALSTTGKFAEAADIYKTVVQNNQNSSWAGTAQYETAMLSLASENPQRDYAQALAKLEEFLTQYPQHEQAFDARNWRQAIKTLLDLRRENDRLHKNIEQLKQLDMRQEEKRLGR